MLFEQLEPELDQLGGATSNRALVSKLDEPDANWRAYRGESGTEPPQALRLDEQAALLKKLGVKSETCWPPGARRQRTSFRGYKLAKLQRRGANTVRNRRRMMPAPIARRCD